MSKRIRREEQRIILEPQVLQNLRIQNKKLKLIKPLMNFTESLRYLKRLQDSMLDKINQPVMVDVSIKTAKKFILNYNLRGKAENSELIE